MKAGLSSFKTACKLYWALEGEEEVCNQSNKVSAVCPRSHDSNQNWLWWTPALESLDWGTTKSDSVNHVCGPWSETGLPPSRRDEASQTWSLGQLAAVQPCRHLSAIAEAADGSDRTKECRGWDVNPVETIYDLWYISARDGNKLQRAQ